MHTQVHIPDIKTWKGLLWMVCLGNLIVFLEALSYQTYLDLHSLSRDRLSAGEVETEKLRRARFNVQTKHARKTFADFRKWFSDRYVVKQAGRILDIDQDIFHVCFIPKSSSL